MTTAEILLILPMMGKLIDMGFSLVSPDGVKIASLEELESLLAQIEAVPNKSTDTEGGANENNG